MDEDYPTEDDLKRIETWEITRGQDLFRLMEFVRKCWWSPEWGWHKRRRAFSISTGGWSGNEDLVNAMRKNRIFWTLCWYSSRRGGHFRFRIPKMAGKDNLITTH